MENITWMDVCAELLLIYQLYSRVGPIEPIDSDFLEKKIQLFGIMRVRTKIGTLFLMKHIHNPPKHI